MQWIRFTFLKSFGRPLSWQETQIDVRRKLLKSYCQAWVMPLPDPKRSHGTFSGERRLSVIQRSLATRTNRRISGLKKARTRCDLCDADRSAAGAADRCVGVIHDALPYGPLAVRWRCRVRHQRRDLCHMGKSASAITDAAGTVSPSSSVWGMKSRRKSTQLLIFASRYSRDT